jgi:cell pole-organizing protein PopZ
LQAASEETAIPEPMPDDGAPTLEEAVELPPEPTPEPAPEPTPVVAAAAPVMTMDQVIQRAAESAVAASGALATVAPTVSAASAPAGDHSLAFGVTEQHIETAVREVLKPRLRDWLDKNLANLVERLVREEIQRLVEQSERPS